MSQLPAEIKKKSFLVVDDQEELRILIGHDLKKLGIEKVDFASSGNEAFELLKTKRQAGEGIEFILTDLVMNNGTGLDLVKNIRSHLLFDNIPILMISSKAEVNQVIQCIKEGVNSYIVKPWDIEMLAKKIIDCNKRMRSSDSIKNE